MDLQKGDIEAQFQDFQSPKTSQGPLLAQTSSNICLKFLFDENFGEDTESPEKSSADKDIPNPESPNESPLKKQIRSSKSPGLKQEDHVSIQIDDVQLDDNGEYSESKSRSQRSCSQSSDNYLLQQGSSDYVKDNSPPLDPKTHDIESPDENKSPKSLKGRDLITDKGLAIITNTTVPSLTDSMALNQDHKISESSQKGCTTMSKLAASQGDTSIVKMPEEESKLQCPQYKESHLAKQEEKDNQYNAIIRIEEFKPCNSGLQRPKSFPKRARGFPNTKNSCFRNAILQNLMHALLFAEFFLSRNNLNNLSKLFRGLLIDRRVNLLNEKQRISILRKIDTIIYQANNSLKPKRQHDAIEFMKTFLEIISEENNRVVTKPSYRQLSTTIQDGENFKMNILEKSHEWYEYNLARENSIVTDLFGGQILNITKCEHCHTQKVSFDNYWDLTLGFKNHIKSSSEVYLLMDMLKDFTRKEEFLKEGIYCGNCKEDRPTSYQSSIYKLPEILVIDFKRFKQEDGWEKIYNDIQFPVAKLDLSEIVKDSDDISVKDHVYTLFGVVNHYGTLESGHYTADCMDFITGEWRHFNDSKVKRSEIGEYESYQCSPSILFYVKTSHLEHFKELKKSFQRHERDEDSNSSDVDYLDWCGLKGLSQKFGNWISSKFSNTNDPNVNCISVNTIYT